MIKVLVLVASALTATQILACPFMYKVDLRNFSGTKYDLQKKVIGEVHRDAHGDESEEVIFARCKTCESYKLTTESLYNPLDKKIEKKYFSAPINKPEEKTLLRTYTFEYDSEGRLISSKGINKLGIVREVSISWDEKKVQVKDTREEIINEPTTFLQQLFQMDLTYLEMPSSSFFEYILTHNEAKVINREDFLKYPVLAYKKSCISRDMLCFIDQESEEFINFECKKDGETLFCIGKWQDLLEPRRSISYKSFFRKINGDYFPFQFHRNMDQIIDSTLEHQELNSISSFDPASGTCREKSSVFAFSEKQNLPNAHFIYSGINETDFVIDINYKPSFVFFRDKHGNIPLFELERKPFSDGGSVFSN